MPRDRDKNNDSRRGRRDRSAGGKGRPGGFGGDRQFGKRSFDKGDGEKRRFGSDRDGRPPRRRDDDGPRRDYGDRPRTARFDRDDRGRGEKRDFKPRGDRPKFERGDRPKFDRSDRAPRGERAEGRFSDRKVGDRPRAPRFDRDDRGRGEGRDFKSRSDRPNFERDDRPRFDRDDRAPRGERRDGRPERQFSDRKFSDRPRKDFGSRDRNRDFEGRDRGEMKPWRKKDDRAGDDRGDRPRFSRDRGDRPKFDRPRERREDRDFDRPRRERPKGRMDWQEHPRSERHADRKSDRRDRKSDRGDRFADRPRRDNEDESKIFAKRPAFGGRGAYRERERHFDRRSQREEPKPKKTGERIAKVLARAGLASRRDAEEMVTQGRVSVNGRVINSPALDVTANDVVAVDGKNLPPRERTRLFMYHKPRGLMTTHDDPEGRPTVFDNLPEGLPRLISIGRLDFNTEGLLLLTNDGGLARTLELPDTGWLRRYRVRAHGEVTQAQLDELKKGVEVEGVKYGPIEATLERDQGANVWVVFAIREGKNREVRNVMAHLGLEVNRLIRVSYGPFQLGELAEGQVEEVKTRVLREQLGERVAKLAGADFARPEPNEATDDDEAPRGKKPFKPKGKSALIADRKGRRVLVQRTGSEEARARNEEEHAAYGPPRRVKRGYHGKRDLTPRDE